MERDTVVFAGSTVGVGFELGDLEELFDGDLSDLESSADDTETWQIPPGRKNGSLVCESVNGNEEYRTDGTLQSTISGPHLAVCSFVTRWLRRALMWSL
jgi:hypothetical protein